MRMSGIRHWFGGMALLFLAGTAAAATPLPAETLTVEKLGAVGPHWVFALDEALLNEIDARVDVYDADAMRWIGQIDAGYYPGFALSPDGRTTTVVTTYFSRGSRGQRTDVIEFTDNTTLEAPTEMVIPAKHAQIPPSQYAVSYSADGHLLFVSDLTPAPSISVIDVQKRSVLSELRTDGCVLAIPSGSYRVAALCEDGRLLTISVDANGKELARAQSEPFFDVDKDPVFVQGAPSADGAVFLSFLGEVHEVDLTGPAPRFKPTWSIVTSAERGKWRPGADQVLAIHRSSKRMYVPMHQGGEGTHKDGGTEIWVLDMNTHARLARWRFGAAAKLPPIAAITVSQDDSPVVLAVAMNMEPVASTLLVLDPTTGKIRHAEANFGQSAWMLLTR
jgi:methylamine dehydrogenase heavy chain